MKRYYPVLEPSIASREKKYVNDCLDTSWVGSLGKYVPTFEAAFARFTGTKYAVTTCNGTAALHLTMLALGIKKGDEVIVPDMTYVASANAVQYVGAKPVFVDCEGTTFNIDSKKIEEKITKRTKAIMVVHLFGNPCRMDEIMRIARKYGLRVVEDAAQAHGATYKGKKAGSFGIANAFSFYGNKIMTTGEGGAVTTDSKKIRDRVELLKGQALSKRRRYFHTELGYNYLMTNIQAAIGLSQLERLPTFLRKKRQIREWYRAHLGDLVKKGVVSFQEPTSGSRPSWWVSSCLLSGFSAEKLGVLLKREGIETRPFFFPLHNMPHLRQRGSFPVSNRLAREGIIFPASTTLAERDIAFISKIVKKHL